MNSELQELTKYFEQHRLRFHCGFRHEVTEASWPAHSHACVEIAHFSRVSARAVFDSGIELAVDAQGFLITPAGQAHATHFDSVPAETAAIMFEVPGPLPTFLRRSCVIPPCQDPYLGAEVLYLTSMHTIDSSASQTEFDLRVSALVVRLARIMDSHVDTPNPGALYVATAHAYMQEHFATIAKLDEVADHVGISEDYLRHLFKEHRGVSPKQFLLHMRIAQARQLLVETRMLVKEVAAACGFENERHFAACFSRIEGSSPSSYRTCHVAEDGSKPQTAPRGFGPASTNPPECSQTD